MTDEHQIRNMSGPDNDPKQKQIEWLASDLVDVQKRILKVEALYNESLQKHAGIANSVDLMMAKVIEEFETHLGYAVNGILDILTKQRRQIRILNWVVGFLFCIVIGELLGNLLLRWGF